MAWEGAAPFKPLHWPVPVRWPHGNAEGLERVGAVFSPGKGDGVWAVTPTVRRCRRHQVCTQLVCLRVSLPLPATGEPQRAPKPAFLSAWRQGALVPHLEVSRTQSPPLTCSLLPGSARAGLATCLFPWLRKAPNAGQWTGSRGQARRPPGTGRTLCPAPGRALAALLPLQPPMPRGDPPDFPAPLHWGDPRLETREKHFFSGVHTGKS